VLLRWFIEDIGGVLIDPRTLIAVSRVEKRGLGEPLIFVVMFSLAIAASIPTPMVMLISMFLPFELATAAYALSLALGLLAGLVLWLVDTALMYVISRLLGGSGSLSEVAAAVGYSYAATWPIALCGLLSLATGWLTEMFLLMVGAAVEIVWRWYVLSHALSEACAYSALRGLLTLVLARIVLLALPVALGLASIAVVLGGALWR